MKHKMLALILALTVVSWAQEATQTTPSAPQQSTAPADKAKCACCDKMASADAKGEHSCCAHHDHSADTKDMASGAGKDGKSCCGGKDAKSCMRAEKGAGSCCKDSCAKDKTAAANCGDKCGKGCCSSKKMEHAGMSCCAHEKRG